MRNFFIITTRRRNVHNLRIVRIFVLKYDNTGWLKRGVLHPWLSPHKIILGGSLCRSFPWTIIDFSSLYILHVDDVMLACISECFGGDFQIINPIYWIYLNHKKIRGILWKLLSYVLLLITVFDETWESQEIKLW